MEKEAHVVKISRLEWRWKTIFTQPDWNKSITIVRRFKKKIFHSTPYLIENAVILALTEAMCPLTMNRKHGPWRRCLQLAREDMVKTTELEEEEGGGSGELEFPKVCETNGGKHIERDFLKH